MPEQKPKHPPLPKELREQLDAFRKQLWRIKITEAILAGIFGLIVSFILILFLERFIETPTWARLLNLILGFSIFAIFAPLWINRWVLKHRRESQIARLISEKYPKLGDRLLGVVELEKQTEDAKSLSPELRKAAMRTVAYEVKQRDLSEALPTSWHKKWLIGVFSVALITAGGFYFMPEAGYNALKRWLIPATDTERYTRTQIDIDQYKDGLIVPLKEDFSIHVKLHQGSQQHPSAEARYGKEKWMKKYFENKKYKFDFKGKINPAEVSIKVGDDNEVINVIPTSRPIIQKTEAQVIWPEYLERPNIPESMQLSSGIIQPIVGSTVYFKSTTNRDLRSATSSELLIEAEQAELGEEKTYTSSGIQLHPIIKGNAITTGPIPVAARNQKFILNWVDKFGLENKKSRTFVIEPVADQAPNAYLESKEYNFISLLDSVFDFKIGASDDFGIKLAGFSWEGELYGPSAKSASKGESTLYFPAPGETKELSFTDEFIFSPKHMGITQPQRLTIRTWVEDQLPDRKRTYSEQKIIVDLYTREMMEQTNLADIEKLKNRIEEAHESSLENKEKTDDLKYLLDKANKDATSSDEKKRKAAQTKQQELTEKIDDLKEKEKELQDELDDIQKDARDLFNQAAQDKTLNKEALKDLMKLQQNLQEASDAKNKAQKNLDNAQSQQGKSQQNSNQEQQKQAQDELKQASENQQKSMQAMQKAANKAKEAKENAELATFVNRLKQLAVDQDEVKEVFVESSLAENNPDIDLVPLSHDFDDLAPSYKSAFYQNYNLQKQIISDFNWLREDMTEYFARSKTKGLDKVIEAIEKSDADTYFDGLLNDIQGNQWAEAFGRADEMSTKIEEWAKLMGQAASNGSGSSNASGGQQNQMNDDDFDFVMRVMNMVKQEIDIRAKTRAMEQLKRTLEHKQKKTNDN